MGYQWVMWALLDAEIMGWSWQAFLLLNLAGLIALSFWLGRLVTRLERLEKDVQWLTAEITSQVHERTRKFEEYEKEVVMMRGAYHHMAGFLQAHHRDWEGYDFSRGRAGN